MFTDFVVLMLLNMVAALVTLAAYLLVGATRDDQAKWTPAFAISGGVALICGLYMAFTWPLPGVYNVAFGEPSAMLGAALLGAALALAKGWSLRPVGIYATVGSIAAIIIGLQIFQLELTQKPALSAAGFILTGIGGIMFSAALCMQHSRAFRIITAVVLLAAAAIWALTGYMATAMHLGNETFQKWVPHDMQRMKEMSAEQDTTR